MLPYAPVLPSVNDPSSIFLFVTPLLLSLSLSFSPYRCAYLLASPSASFFLICLRLNVYAPRVLSRRTCVHAHTRERLATRQQQPAVASSIFLFAHCSCTIRTRQPGVPVIPGGTARARPEREREREREGDCYPGKWLISSHRVAIAESFRAIEMSSTCLFFSPSCLFSRTNETRNENLDTLLEGGGRSGVR